MTVALAPVICSCRHLIVLESTNLTRPSSNCLLSYPSINLTRHLQTLF